MNARKEPDMGRLAQDVELKGLFKALSEVHARKNNRPPFKKVGDAQIIRANDGAGVFFDADILLSNNEEKRKKEDVLSKKIAENMLVIAANFLTQGITPNNVPDRIYQALAISYAVAHWTAAVVTVNNFRERYKKLYDDCINNLEINPNKPSYADSDFLRAKNVIEANLGIRGLNGNLQIQDQQESHKRVLDAVAPQFHVRFFDSIPGGHYQKYIQQSLTSVMPRMRFTTGKSAVQEGMLCGDFATLNGFRVAVLNKPMIVIPPKQLRQLTETLKTAQANLMEGEESEAANAALVNLLESESAPLTPQQYTATERVFDMVNNQASVAPNAIISDNDPEIEGNNASQPTNDNDIVAHLIDIQNKTEAVLVLLKAAADYSAADLIRETLKDPAFAKEENIRKFIAANKLSTSLTYSDQLPLLLNQLAHLVAGNIPNKKQEFSKQEKITFAEAARDIANTFASTLEKERQDALNAAKTKPKPPVTKPVENAPNAQPTKPVVTVTTNQAPVRPRIVTPATTQPAAPSTPDAPPRVEPSVVTTPSLPPTPTEKKSSLLYKVGMTLGMIALTALAVLFALAIVYAAIFTLPAIIAIGLSTLAVGATLAFIAHKANNPSTSSYTPTDGTYSKVSERMPLVGEYGVKHVTTPTLRKTTTADKENNEDTTHTHKSSIKPFRK